MDCTVRLVFAALHAMRDVAANTETAEIFARGTRLTDAASQWIARFNEHEAKAVAEIVNLVLRASGCHVQVDEDDIADPDNCPSRLGEIQDEYNNVREPALLNAKY